MDLKIKLLEPKAVMPKYAHITDAGFDLTAISKETIYDHDIVNVTYGTGIAVEIPAGYVGLIFPRSSIHKQNLSLSNCVGVIDSGYRGEIKFIFRYTERSKDISFLFNQETHKLPTDIDFSFTYNVGDRIGQMVIVPYMHCKLKKVDTLNESDRGEGGFGSTGK